MKIEELAKLMHDEANVWWQAQGATGRNQPYDLLSEQTRQRYLHVAAKVLEELAKEGGRK